MFHNTLAHLNHELALNLMLVGVGICAVVLVGQDIHSSLHTPVSVVINVASESVEQLPEFTITARRPV